MEPQSNAQNDSQEIKYASKLLTFELSLFFLILIIVLATLNYFNILSLSQIFPTQLGWLPHQPLNSESSFANKIPPVPKPPTTNQQKRISANRITISGVPALEEVTKGKL